MLSKGSSTTTEREVPKAAPSKISNSEETSFLKEFSIDIEEKIAALNVTLWQHLNSQNQFNKTMEGKIEEIIGTLEATSLGKPHSLTKNEFDSKRIINF